MKRIVFFLSTILLIPLYGSAQSFEQYTMWNQNHYLLNPAAAGNLDYFEAALGFRRQWAGIKEAPKTFYATGHTVLNRPKTHQLSALRISSTVRSKFYNTRKNLRPYLKHAIGGQLATHEFGAFQKTVANVSYALHLPINREIYWSFGLTAGLNNFGFDESKASVLDQGDQVYDAYVAGENSNKLNVNAGTYIYSETFFAGFASHQLLRNDLEIADIQTTTEQAALVMQHYFMGGYHFYLNNDFKLSPNVLAKLQESNPLSIEAGVTLTYQEAFYAGFNYRGEDAISILVGAEINYLFKVGYAYDYTTSDLSQSASGSHEIFIGITLF